MMNYEHIFRETVNTFLIQNKENYPGGWPELVNEVVAKIESYIKLYDLKEIDTILLSPIAYYIIYLYLIETNPFKYKNNMLIDYFQNEYGIFKLLINPLLLNTISVDILLKLENYV